MSGASPFSTKLAVAEKHEPLRRSARTPSLLRRAPGQSARACRSELLRPALGSRRSGRTSDKWRARAWASKVFAWVLKLWQTLRVGKTTIINITIGFA